MIDDEELDVSIDDIDVDALDEEEVVEEATEETADEAGEAETTETSDDSAKIEELEKRYVNLYAEYENYRKRTAKEKEQLYADAIAEVTSKWLPILDNIDRAAIAGESADEASVEKVLQGIDMMSKQAIDILNKIGVTEIAAERGTAFDPNMHEAVMHIDDPDLGEQQIAVVFQKGYIYKDRVIRHAVVQVAN